METRARSMVKAVVWNVFGLMMMAAVGAILTGSVQVGGLMAVINAGIGLSCYFLYERIWSGIAWGRTGHAHV